ncbi:MAG: hypothetical protein BWZ07_03059 [Alphaproteobacteria bacterium ADurb.BinA280]|nr:MAG: hypothetical protein BWZ07_03059 [Alphaproteobacteria bacterium ADurb.BinA280]
MRGTHSVAAPAAAQCVCGVCCLAESTGVSGFDPSDVAGRSPDCKRNIGLLRGVARELFSIHASEFFFSHSPPCPREQHNRRSGCVVCHCLHADCRADQQRVTDGNAERAAHRARGAERAPADHGRTSPPIHCSQADLRRRGDSEVRRCQRQRCAEAAAWCQPQWQRACPSRPWQLHPRPAQWRTGATQFRPEQSEPVAGEAD